jgi:hypothetical protein
MSEASDELKKVIKEVKEQASQIAKTGRDLTEQGQTIVDLADANLQLNDLLHYQPDIEYQIMNWQSVSNTLHNVRQGIEGIKVSINSTSGGITGSSSDIFNHKTIFEGLPPESRLLAESAKSKINWILDRDSNEKDLISQMISFGLDKADPGKKSPVELIQTGYDAFKRPVAENNPISTSLIPIREAINSSIARLLSQRQMQEEAKNVHSKIVSIGKHLKRDEISNETVEIWADQWERMLDEYLSSAKEQSIKRDEWETRIKEVTIWFKSFLEGLDPQKLRKKINRIDSARDRVNG